MEPQTVIHQTVNGKYRIVFEQSAVKGVIGFKVEVNGDLIDIVKAESIELLDFAKAHAPKEINA
mgnify:CR=1 FL=1